MSPILSPSALPLLSSQVTFLSSSEGLIVDSDECSLTFKGSSATALEAVRDRLDGTQRIEALVREGRRITELGAVLGVLQEEGLLLDAAAAPEATSTEDFLAAYNQECQFWTREIFAQPFWKALLSGQAPQRVVLGWGLEFFHYVEGANEHMAMAVAQCRDDTRLRRWLADHYADEYDHSGLFLQGLVASGLEREQVLQAPPLASTRALINHFTELASLDTHAYLGAFGIMQANRERSTREAIAGFYDPLSAHYPFAAGMFTGFRKHAALDVELGHQELVLERLCARPGLEPSSLARKAMDSVRSTAEQFIVFFEGILDFYEPEGAPVPRRPVDIRTVA